MSLTVMHLTGVLYWLKYLQPGCCMLVWRRKRFVTMCTNMCMDIYTTSLAGSKSTLLFILYPLYVCIDILLHIIFILVKSQCMTAIFSHCQIRAYEYGTFTTKIHTYYILCIIFEIDCMCDVRTVPIKRTPYCI